MASNFIALGTHRGKVRRERRQSRGTQVSKARDILKLVLGRVGLLEFSRTLLRPMRALRDRYRRQGRYYPRYLRFKLRYGRVLRHRLYPIDQERKVALVSSVHFPEVEIEFAVIKALQLAGFTPVLLIERDEWLLRKYYELAAIDAVHMWQEFTDQPDPSTAEATVNRCSSPQELMEFEYEGARVGRFAISTAMRSLKVGSFDLKSSHERETLVDFVGRGMSYARAAQRILDKYKPALAVFIDKGYSPKGELFDHCLARDIDCVSWDLAHRSSAMMFKRFTYDNRDTSTTTLSPDSWKRICTMSFTDAHRRELEQELLRCYTSGDWYSMTGIQFNKPIMGPEETQKRLGLDPAKKSVFIFPHVSWDASLWWGGSLYLDYDEWLVDTVREACKNDKVNWVIKIHPAHVGKAIREGFRMEPSEVITLRQYFGDLPAHIFTIPAKTDISTASLFPVMDYCITVRGRVGIEAARHGIPVLTAGRGSYDHKGFTVDSESRKEYVERLANIQTIPRLSDAQRELGERFAYGFYLLRPLRLTSTTLTYHESSEKRASKGRVNIRCKEDWYHAADIRALADWLSDRTREDFLNPIEVIKSEADGTDLSRETRPQKRQIN
jgi:hypothetical protein